MTDVIKIQLIQGADENGEGGTVVDAPAAKMPDGHLSLILDSFRQVYGAHRDPPEGADPTKEAARNYTYRLRQYSGEVVKAVAVKKAKNDAASQAGTQADMAIDAVEVIE